MLERALQTRRWRAAGTLSAIVMIGCSSDTHLEPDTQRASQDARTSPSVTLTAHESASAGGVTQNLDILGEVHPDFQGDTGRAVARAGTFGGAQAGAEALGQADRILEMHVHVNHPVQDEQGALELVGEVDR